MNIVDIRFYIADKQGKITDQVELSSLPFGNGPSRIFGNFSKVETKYNELVVGFSNDFEAIWIDGERDIEGADKIATVFAKVQKSIDYDTYSAVIIGKALVLRTK